MEILPDWIPSPAMCFAIFFGVSFAILAMILMAGIPGVFRSVRKHFRQAVARHRRSRRMLADKDALQEKSRLLEGLCLFPDEFDRSGEIHDDMSDVTSDAA